jgi:hypothetical protein
MKLTRSHPALLKSLATPGFSVAATMSVAPPFAGGTPAPTGLNWTFSTKLSHLINGTDPASAGGRPSASARPAVAPYQNFEFSIYEMGKAPSQRGTEM